MKSVKDLELGYNDAENYCTNSKKEFFNNVFVKDDNLQRLLQSDTYFLIGEKGTGKTAYAVFLSNNEYKNTKSQIIYIRETDYKMFAALRSKNQLILSDYSSIWKVILLLLIAFKIEQSDIKSIFSKNQKFNELRSAIRDYHNIGLNPEMTSVMEVIDKGSTSVELFGKAHFGQFGLSAQEGQKKENQVKITQTTFQSNLNLLYRKLTEALCDLKLDYNRFLFIDGIDFRPGDIEYNTYLECVKGLANASWELNNDLFGKIKDSKGRMKVILLLRPDIFCSLEMQNSTNKLLNNSVYLDWRTTYPEHRESKLFLVSDKLLSQQQDDSSQLNIGNVWDHYFPWKNRSTNPNREHDTPFIEMLRLSYSRPRDIITMLIYLKKGISVDVNYFPRSVFESDKFRNDYSNYVINTIKDQLSFYYSSEEYEYLRQFLNQFKGHRSFDYSFFEEQFKIFTDLLLKKVGLGEVKDDFPSYVDSPEELLQFLYEANIICFTEKNYRGKEEVRFCYREREISNIRPKVKPHTSYRFHEGLHRSLNLY